MSIPIDVAVSDRFFCTFRKRKKHRYADVFDEVINTLLTRYSNIPWNNSLENLLYVYVN